MFSCRPTGSLAQRRRQLLTDELTEAALQLLAVKDFETATIDEMVAAAGVSRRTFFRYFASKEDVVVQPLASLGSQMCAELAARPLEESPGTALRHAVSVAMVDCAGHREQAWRVVSLILRTPALRARFRERQDQWRDDIAARLTERLGVTTGLSLYPQLAAGITLAAFDTVLQAWSDSGGRADPAALTEQAFALIAPALDPGEPHPA